MNLVNSYFILEGDHGFSVLPREIKKEINHTVMRLTLNEDGFGKFEWGREPFLLHGFEITVFRYDSRRIICFTSTPKNVIEVNKLIKNTIGADLKISRIKIGKKHHLDNPQVKNFKMDPIIGVSFTLTNDILSWPILIKVYTTGLTTFNMINNKEMIKQIIEFNLELLDS
ncbi:hypothetical protein [Priestia megaterium]|uniref:hypothetical protein n=1 Tax=Priestia megaterium TaxID=1404 RepID=UPI0023645400|nr:hypothetical protein [Priestia megaterium]MDD1515791.1 hypothetical protein [Priestia megaterium]